SFVTDMYIQSCITMLINSKCKFHDHIFYISFFALIGYMLFAFGTRIMYPDIVRNDVLRRMWHPGQPGFIAHLISSVFEWVLIMSFGAYVYPLKNLCKIKVN